MTATAERLLVVEDDPDLQMLIKVATTAKDTEVCITGSLAETREHLEDCPHQRFVLDLWLPDGLSSDLLDDGTIEGVGDVLVWTNVHRSRAVVQGVAQRHPDVRVIPKGDDFQAFLHEFLVDHTTMHFSD